jgi:hypothetical protein
MAITFQGIGKGISNLGANIKSNWQKQQAEAKEQREFERQVKKEAMQIQKQEFRTQYSQQVQARAKIQARLQAKSKASQMFAPRQNPMNVANPTFEALLFGKKQSAPKIQTPKRTTQRGDSKEVQILKKLLKEAQASSPKPRATSSSSNGGQNKRDSVNDLFWKY